MTRAKRYAHNLRSAGARRPYVSFQGIEVYADPKGDLVLHEQNSYVHIDSNRIPALVKFLRENFIRGDK